MTELSARYGQAWANNLGEDNLSADSSFNPNLVSHHWEPMKVHEILVTLPIWVI
jgi:hypothetical protein